MSFAGRNRTPVRFSFRKNLTHHVVRRVAVSFTCTGINFLIIPIPNDYAATHWSTAFNRDEKRQFIKGSLSFTTILNSHAVIIG